MRIGVFSDTHKDLRNLQAAHDKLAPLDAVFHCGDGGASDLAQLGVAFDCPIYAVAGNCDFMSDLPDERVVTLAGHRFLLLHGHRRRDEWELARLAEDEHCHAVFFGHTHIPLLSPHGTLLVCNPGSLSHPRRGSPVSCALLTVSEKDFDIRMVSV